MNLSAATISELVVAVKNLVEGEFQEVLVQGEVSNLSIASSGHCYFTLSDDEASLSCVMFKNDLLRNPGARNIKNGDKIIVLGPVSVYQKKSYFQIIVKRIIPAGEGLLKIQFDRLKAKLAQEGLFDLDRKKKLPLFPKKIAVITSEQGAALQDFLNVLKRRTFWFEVVIIPALVQGQSAPQSLLKAFQTAQKIESVDLIVLTRGGGSIEDLWAFNDENLVRAISKSLIPVISAIGHQVDFTLCDFVADFRAETPTAAAETISQPQTELKRRLDFCRIHLSSGLVTWGQKIEILTKKLHPREVLANFWRQIQLSQKKLSLVRLADRGEELTGLPEANRRVDELMMRLKHSIQLIETQNMEVLSRLDQVLNALNPNNILRRGYSYVKVDDDCVLTSAKKVNLLKSSSPLHIVFYDGEVRVYKE